MPTFTTNFAPPAPPAELNVVADVPTSAVTLSWASTSLGADFTAYRVYRQIGVGEWVLLATLGVEAIATYTDYLAPLAVSLTYRVTVSNLDFESDPAVASTELSVVEWWLVRPGDSSLTFRLFVTTDYSDVVPVEEEEFVALGRRHKVQVQGEVLGTEGTLSVHLSNENRGLRDLLVRVAQGQEQEYVLLKTPYSEVYRVRLGDIRRRRRAAGHSEVTFPFTEVA
jgi:hypothetical protein